MATRYNQQKNVVNQLLVHAPYNGGPLRDFGYFDKRDGLGLEVEKVSYGENPVAAGVRSRADATLRRPFSDTSAEELRWWDNHTGSDATIIVHYKGDDGLPMGEIGKYTGKVAGSAPPEGDTTASERSELALTVFVDVAAA